MITQSEINDLLDMTKHRETVDAVIYPIPGERVSIPLLSADGREKFLLDINRGRIKLTKVTFQNRVRVNLELVRLDLDGPPHRNPDDEEIPSPHVHVYRAGYEARWARPASEYIDAEILASKDSIRILDAFMDYCNIVTKPNIHTDLFS